MAMTESGELVLVIGDTHIPHRKAELPEGFRSLLYPGCVSHVLCLGNLVDSDTLAFLKSLGTTFHAVTGDLDIGQYSTEHSAIKIVRIGDVSIGLTHGDSVTPWSDPSALLNMARSLDVDVLCHGHTHQTQILSDAVTNKMLLNPGSATGAYSPFNAGAIPTFLLLSIKGRAITVFAYECRGSEVRVARTEWTKHH